MYNKTPILYFHSIAPKQNMNWSRYWLTLELRYFEKLLEYLSLNSYHSLFLDEYFKNNNERRSICLTFDDGYLDNFIFVFPLLKKYNIKATIFISPDFVNRQSIIHKTLEDYWNNQVTINDLNNWGFLSWEEMAEMEKSGLVDIQSHTLTHTKYFVSDKLVGFHHPGSDCLYPISNIFSEHRPYYIANKKFEKLIQYGHPLFQEKSSVIAKPVNINPDFNKTCIDMLKYYFKENVYDFHSCFKIVKSEYEKFKGKGELILGIENEFDYRQRIISELKKSKESIEKKLQKNVKYCCWPHGDNDEFVHNLALQLGYKATTIGKFEDSDSNVKNRIGKRITMNPIFNSKFLSINKFVMKIKAYLNLFPYNKIDAWYNWYKNS